MYVFAIGFFYIFENEEKVTYAIKISERKIDGIYENFYVKIYFKKGQDIPRAGDKIKIRGWGQLRRTPYASFPYFYLTGVEVLENLGNGWITKEEAILDYQKFDTRDLEQNMSPDSMPKNKEEEKDESKVNDWQDNTEVMTAFQFSDDDLPFQEDFMKEFATGVLFLLVILLLISICIGLVDSIASNITKFKINRMKRKVTLKSARELQNKTTKQIQKILEEMSEQ